ncbi:MAG: M16 family metallopeptidase [Candidatus Aminicenantales bacterium]
MKKHGPIPAAFAAGLLLLTAVSLGEAGLPPAVHRSVLPNGLTVITQSEASSAVTVVEILIRGGAAAEPAGRSGISHLTTRLAMDIPDRDMARDFMIKALQSSMISRDDDAVIHLEFLTEFAEPILAASAKIFADPLITDVRIDGLTEMMNHQRRIEADDAFTEAGFAQREAFFRGSAHAGSTLGTEDSVHGLKIKEIRDFYERRFVAGNIVVVAVSDLDAEELRALIARHFGKIRPGRPDEAESALTVKDPPYRPRTIEKKQAQSVVSCAFPLPPLSRRDYARIALIENVLGRGPGSRLWALRVEKKLAYSVSSPPEMFRRAGFLSAVLETDAAKTEIARGELEAVLRDFREKGISAEEFEAGRAVAGADFLRANEIKGRRASTLGFFETSGLGAEYINLFSAELDSLTLDEINAEIKRLFDPGRASWVIVGPGQ